MQKNKATITISVNLLEALSRVSATNEPDPAPIKVRQIRRLSQVVSALNVIATSFPNAYGWRFIDAESFTKLFKTLAETNAPNGELNSFYWRDMLATIEAYTVMSVWRMVDICQSAFRCIEENAIVPSAILARSALESSVQFVQDARTITASLKQVVKVDLNASLAVNKELELYLVQTVYATRQSDSEEIYKSKNILTVLEKIAKVAKNQPIKEEYELLCEVTHPNFLGRSTYIMSADRDSVDGSELRILSPENGINSDELLQSSLWALSWAIEAQAESTYLVQGAVRDLIKVMPEDIPTRR